MSPPPLFVLGTGHQVGKTLVACGLLTALGERDVGATGVKPVETGCPHDDAHDLVGIDGERLRAASSVPTPPLVTSPYRFAPPLSPALAAEQVGLELTIDDLVAAVEESQRLGRTVVEGPGGPLCPLAPGRSTLDLAVALQARILVVGSDRKGADGQVLLTLEACEHRKANVVGVLLSRRDADGTQLAHETSIRRRGAVTVFETLPTLQPADAATVAAHLETHGVVDALLDVG